MNDFFTRRDACPSCGNHDNLVVFNGRFTEKPAVDYIKTTLPEDVIAREFSNEDYTLMKCPRCELIFQRAILNDAGMMAFYNEWLPNSPIIHAVAAKDQAEQHAKLTQELFVLAKLMGRPSRHISILDFGMGQGRFCMVAKSMGFQVTGSDISVEVLESAAKDGIETSRLEDLNGRKFDFINTEQVFEHLGNPREQLQGLVSLLKQDGIIRISVPNGRGIEKRLKHMDFSAPRGHRNYLVPVTPGQHVNTFSYSSLRAFGKTLGLEAIAVPFWYQYSIIPAMNAKIFVKSILRPIYYHFMKPAAIYFRPLKEA
ncbi:class I SAM-dependent methyltransferase [Thiocystis violacea]|uniref:class I SAM-dependent methyltransferase n=1 Tax=Thiocystis violacea TaxID=13725 RepID=UPI001905D2E2|nr:class I SAM-dependent methyltransferase [Thiocystis violacea]MBK1719135.1 hypothetical protein [Thiocystis violacea]